MTLSPLTDELRISVNRTRRAAKLSVVLRRHGADGDSARAIVGEARDRIAVDLAGITPVSPTTWAMACALLDELPEERAHCRFASDDNHTCRSNTGQPIHGSQECWSETRASLLENATPADFTAVIESMANGVCGFCTAPAVESGWREDYELAVCPDHRKHLAGSDFDKAISS